MTMFTRNGGTYKTPVGEESMTEQAHKDEVNIQRIMKRYEKTGLIEHVNQHQGTYVDYTNAPDYHTAMTLIANANSVFESVPARIRAEFGNDPAQFLEFMQNPDNFEKIEEYGFDTSHLTGEGEVMDHFDQASHDKIEANRARLAGEATVDPVPAETPESGD